MVKRELSGNSPIDAEGPRAKRRKDESANPPTTDDVDVQEEGANSDQEHDGNDNAVEDGPVMTVEEIRDEGLKVLQVLKEATNKE